MDKKYKMAIYNSYTDKRVSIVYEVEAPDVETAREMVWDLVIGYELFAEEVEVK